MYTADIFTLTSDSLLITADGYAPIVSGWTADSTVTVDSSTYTADGYYIQALTDSEKIDLIISMLAAQPSAAEIAAAILAAAQVTPIHTDMRKTNGQTIIGDGTEGNKFRSHLVG